MSVELYQLTIDGQWVSPGRDPIDDNEAGADTSVFADDFEDVF